MAVKEITGTITHPALRESAEVKFSIDLPDPPTASSSNGPSAWENDPTNWFYERLDPDNKGKKLAGPVILTFVYGEFTIDEGINGDMVRGFRLFVKGGTWIVAKNGVGRISGYKLSSADLWV